MPSDPVRSSPHDLWLGRRLGSYEIDGILGAGTVSVVYAARRSDGVDVALKVLRPFAVADRSILDLFVQEIDLTGRFDHPNVVRAGRGGDIGGVWYLELERLDGRTVADRLHPNRALAQTDLVNMGIQISSALQHVHDAEVVHRDVKPANVLLDDQRGAILFDFGLAHDLTGPPPRKGRVFGSPMYLSPEQAMAESVDGRADIYSWVASLYRMLTGQAHFSGLRYDLLHAHVHDNPPPANVGGTGLTAMLTRAMQKSPSDRFQSGDEMSGALESLRA